MTKPLAKPYGARVKALMAEKSRLLSKAKAFSDMGLDETAGPVWLSAASYEERIAPLLEARTCIAIPNTRPSSGITNHDPDTASSDRPIPAAARWRIAVHVLSAERRDVGGPGIR
jgi:hypothetical protein